MASIGPIFPTPSTRPDPYSQNHNFRTPRLSISQSKHSYPSFNSYSSADSALCCCNNSRTSGSVSGDDDSSIQRWDSAIQDAFKNAISGIDAFVNSRLSQNRRNGGGGAEEKEFPRDDMGDWDWERWKRHFGDVDDQERIISILKSQLRHAVNREDYEDAARLKVAIAAASSNDTVGRVMSCLDNAVKEERFGDAALLRDFAGAGLVGWWAGVSENAVDPYGCIINVSAEHGRYVARSFSPRQLATSMDGAPLFEIFFTINEKGGYKQQAVYLKRRTDPHNFAISSSKLPSVLNNFDPLGPTENSGSLLKETDDDTGDNADNDEDALFEDTLRDLIPGAKIKVVKVTTPGKVDNDFISKVVEQIIEEEDEENDADLESASAEGENESQNDDEKNDFVLDTNSLISDNEENSQIAVKVVGGGLISNLPARSHQKDLLRVPARLERNSRTSFKFTVEEDDDTHSSGGSGKASTPEKPKLQTLRRADSVILDLAKYIGKGRIPMKVLKDVGELINLTLNEARNRQPLSGSTTFNRLDVPGTQDPLDGLYIGAHGLYTSEVIHLRHKFGQWKDDRSGKEPSDVEFYEYVEAVKLTGDPYLPAGQIAFRAKVGKGYQLPHKGIIPEEFGVIARYKGQGHLSEPGFKNPRWVDGELVILDGKYIKAGPVVGFVYWAPEYHFLVFFNRLRLQS